MFEQDYIEVNDNFHFGSSALNKAEWNYFTEMLYLDMEFAPIKCLCCWGELSFVNDN